MRKVKGSGGFKNLGAQGFVDEVLGHAELLDEDLDRVARLEALRDLLESIRDDADKLAEEVRKGGNALDLLLRKAKSTMKALDVELTEAEEAKSAPVRLPAGSLIQARAALEEGLPVMRPVRESA
jgi:vacuolar-type H+-ATPase subunit I/STV1